MGGNSSKSIDFTEKLNILFDTFPNVDYKNGSESNLLEKNINYKNYMKKNIIRAFRRISNIEIVINDNQLNVQFKITPKPNKIYYKIHAQIEFVINKEKKSISNISKKTTDTVNNSGTRNFIKNTAATSALLSLSGLSLSSFSTIKEKK